MLHTMTPAKIAIIGGGPAGLFAAETLAKAGHAVTLYERKPTLGRKFLMAGRGGLNLTHSEDYRAFITRYGSRSEILAPIIKKFSPLSLQDWCKGLGQDTFVGSSGRIFPTSLKASPLLRAWQERLEQLGVTIRLNSNWHGWAEDGALRFTDVISGASERVKPDAVLLALGGASWPRLGSDGSWFDILAARNIPLAPFRPANSGFNVAWSDIFRQRFAGQPVKTIKISFAGKDVPGEIMITDKGVEGGAIYALSAPLREEIEKNGSAVLMLDLRPGLNLEDLTQRLSAPRGSQSLSTYLQKSGGLPPVAINLLRESVGQKTLPDQNPASLARLIKFLPLTLLSSFPIDRAISTAGGISFDALDENFMLRQIPGVFAAGEMLDWEAPTGGYLLQASFATAFHAANGIIGWLREQQTESHNAEHD